MGGQRAAGPGRSAGPVAAESGGRPSGSGSGGGVAAAAEEAAGKAHRVGGIRARPARLGAAYSGRWWWYACARPERAPRPSERGKEREMGNVFFPSLSPFFPFQLVWCLAGSGRGTPIRTAQIILLFCALQIAMQNGKS